MKKIISVCCIIFLISTGLFITGNRESNECVAIGNESRSGTDQSTNYTNQIEFNHETLQLHTEVIQYQIKFHHDDVVNVTLKMFVSYVDETITSAFFLLTDGKTPLLEPRTICYVPERRYVLITPKIRLSVGKFWFAKFLNDRAGKVRIGSAGNESGLFNVTEGEIWYLTLAVPTSLEKGGYSVTLTSSSDSMEVIEVARHGNVGLFSANYNQFSGRYYGVKLGILGGGSICDVNKEVQTKNGSIIDILVGGHRKGTMIVTLPNGEEQRSNQKGYMRYSFLGNETGQWRVEVKGWSIYFRVFIVFLYIDIDPHGRLQ